MDTTRDIIYRNYTLNDEDILDSITGGGDSGHGIGGCTVDTFDLSDVDVVQWLEKRAQGDGSDAGNVYQGVRRIRIAGTLYATTRLTLFDELFSLRAALNPVLAQREEPLDKGYRPLYFSIPTNRSDDYPSGAIDLQVKALPRGIQHTTQRDALGGEDDDPLAIPWQATFICRDPGIYSADPVEVDFTATTANTPCTGSAATDTFTHSTNHNLVAGDRVTFSSLTGGAGLNTTTTYYVISSGLTSTQFKLSTTSGGAAVNFTTDVTACVWTKSSFASGTWTNRGNYLGKFNMLVEVGAGAGTIYVTVGDSNFHLVVPASSGNRILRVKDDKVYTVEENSTEVLAMSSIVFDNDTTWPLIDPGDSSYSVSFHGMAGVKTGSLMWFYEQYA